MKIYAVADLRASSLPSTSNVIAESRQSHTTVAAIVIYFWLYVVLFPILLVFQCFIFISIYY